MLIPVPDAISDEVAVLADPFSVSLHAITRTPPPAEGGRVVVYGAGALGVTRGRDPARAVSDVRGAGDRALPAAARPGRAFGAAAVVDPEPLEGLVEQIARLVRRRAAPAVGRAARSPTPARSTSSTTRSAPQRPWRSGCGSWRARGAVVQMGVNPPGRFEWTPLYFKEVRIVGSNAFGIEEVDGVRKHGLAHYLDMVGLGAHRRERHAHPHLPLDEWREAFAAVADQGGSGAIKVAFDLR